VLPITALSAVSGPRRPRQFGLGGRLLDRSPSPTNVASPRASRCPHDLHPRGVHAFELAAWPSRRWAGPILRSGGTRPEHDLAVLGGRSGQSTTRLQPILRCQVSRSCGGVRYMTAASTSPATRGSTRGMPGQQGRRKGPSSSRRSARRRTPATRRRATTRTRTRPSARQDLHRGPEPRRGVDPPEVERRHRGLCPAVRRAGRCKHRPQRLAAGGAADRGRATTSTASAPLGQRPQSAPTIPAGVHDVVIRLSWASSTWGTSRSPTRRHAAAVRNAFTPKERDKAHTIVGQGLAPR